MSTPENLWRTQIANFKRRSAAQKRQKDNNVIIQSAIIGEHLTRAVAAVTACLGNMQIILA